LNVSQDGPDILEIVSKARENRVLVRGSGTKNPGSRPDSLIHVRVLVERKEREERRKEEKLNTSSQEALRPAE
jgi:hypothetical protein